jgi:hypothetical protein
MPTPVLTVVVGCPPVRVMPLLLVLPLGCHPRCEPVMGHARGLGLGVLLLPPLLQRLARTRPPRTPSLPAGAMVDEDGVKGTVCTRNARAHQGEAVRRGLLSGTWGPAHSPRWPGPVR